MISLFIELVNLHPTKVLEGAGVHIFSVNSHPILRFAHIDATSLKYTGIVTQMRNGGQIDDLLQLDGIITHSVCIHDIWSYRLLLGDVLNLTAVYHIHLRGGNNILFNNT